MPDQSAQHVFASDALLPEGWARDVVIAIDAEGTIETVTVGAAPPPGAEATRGPLIPALPNVHSHAFQRAMAGLAETSGPNEDSFWTWRETMYRIAGSITPEDCETIAAKLYVDMLKAGSAHVGEFHYLHHDRNGRPYGIPEEMANRLIAAQVTSGIAMTLLPTFYAHSGFDGAAPSGVQQRFVHDTDGFLRLMERLEPTARAAGIRLGYAFHSLRAVTLEEMRRLLATGIGDGPIHIHVAEQRRDPEECRAFYGRTEAQLLCDELPIDGNWCFVHATHADRDEIARIAAARATVALCPTTEASLGDGLFPVAAFRKAGGRFGIGSDSHVSTDPAEELRVLEYGQRLRDERRVRIVDGPGQSNGRTLFDAALSGGARALGETHAGIRPGAPARFVVLDKRHPFIASAVGDTRLDRWIFALGDKAVRDVMVDGAWRIRDGRHARDEDIDRAFAAAISRLADA